MTAQELLRDARHLIQDESRWTQFRQARDASGNPIEPQAEEAVRWCAQGAVLRIVEQKHSEVDSEVDRDVVAWRLIEELDREARADGCRMISSLNDRAKNAHKRVLGAFDRAVQRLGA